MTARRKTIVAIGVTLCAVVLLVQSAWATSPAPTLEPEATWRSEQPTMSGLSWPVGLGKIGDIEFWAPNRGLLITEGEPLTVKPGIWAYNGQEWHQISIVCGASEGRIAWAGPGEFWTVSNGRAGQANEIAGNGSETAVNLQDNTLCRFADGKVLASYAHPANQPNSYQEMHAAACLGPSDCWFAGKPLAEPQVGSFHLHWNGTSLENEPYLGVGNTVEEMRALEGRLYESLCISLVAECISSSDRATEASDLAPVMNRINPAGVKPAIEPEEGLFGEGLPLYEPGELPDALGSLRLSVAGDEMWAAAGARPFEPVEEGHKPGQVTVALAVKRAWTQLIGPEHPLGPILAPQDREEEEQLLGGRGTEVAKNAVVSAIAAEPGTESAWIALQPPRLPSVPGRAVLIHVSAEGKVTEEQTLPSAQEEKDGVGPKGAAATLACPAKNDCWLATTEGWLFHLAGEHERRLPRDEHESEYFTGLITYRPPDQGLPQVPPDAPPADTSGLVEEPPSYGGTFAEAKAVPIEASVTLPLLSHLHSRLVHGTTLQLSFHLAVKARVRLIAKRDKAVVAQTPTRTLKAGNQSLLLALNPRRWPTKLALKTHALGPLPTTKSSNPNVSTISTGLVSLPHDLPFGGWEPLP